MSQGPLGISVVDVISLHLKRAFKLFSIGKCKAFSSLPNSSTNSIKRICNRATSQGISVKCTWVLCWAKH